MSDLNTKLSNAVLFAFYGAVFASKGFLQKHRDETFRPKMAIKPVVIGAVAGLIASTQADSPTQGVIESSLVVAIPLVDSAWNELAPPKYGGSDASGRGASYRYERVPKSDGVADDGLASTAEKVEETATDQDDATGPSAEGEYFAASDPKNNDLQPVAAFSEAAHPARDVRDLENRLWAANHPELRGTAKDVPSVNGNQSSNVIRNGLFDAPADTVREAFNTYDQEQASE